MGALPLQQVRGEVRDVRTAGRRRSWPVLVAGACVLLIGAAAVWLIASDRIAELLAPRDAGIEIVAGPEPRGVGTTPGTTPDPIPGADRDDPAAAPDDPIPGADRDEPAAAPDDPEPGFDLVVVQERLRDLRFLVGTADGVEGPQTRAAVMAFQRANGLQVDGIVGPQTLGALDAPRGVEVRGGPGTRLEIDLTRQLLHLFEDGERITTMHVSSGNGQTYVTASGGTASANTPVGEFHIERRISGVRTAALGTLYDPLYFHRGWAIHGSNSVPNQPASHGCIRITRADARWLFERVPDGIPVSLHGGSYVFVPSR